MLYIYVCENFCFSAYISTLPHWYKKVLKLYPKPNFVKMADGIRFFELNTGAKIPSVGFGTGQADPGLVGEAIATAIKVFFFTFFISRRLMMMLKFFCVVKSNG
jgi:hypothetical protein